jgi:uncharacterized membrane protein
MLRRLLPESVEIVSNPDAIAINDAGQVVGTIDIPNRSFIYNNGHIRYIGISQPKAINNAGQVVGQNNGFACLYASGHVTNLGTLPGTVASKAYCINDSGEIIGLCFKNLRGPSPAEPFFYKCGQLRALTTPGWTVYEVTGFNNAGQIVGGGITSTEIFGGEHGSGSIHGMLLTPK